MGNKITPKIFIITTIIMIFCGIVDRLFIDNFIMNVLLAQIILNELTKN